MLTRVRENDVKLLAIYDIDRARVVREVPFPALGELLSPAWSPDGRFVAFSATAVASTGLTMRMNLFGFAVGQLDVARPLQRPLQGWMFEFSLTPGF